MVKTYETGLVLSEKVSTGKVETTDLTDVDFAFTNLVGLVINSLKVSNPEHDRNKRLAEFLSRPTIGDQVAFAEFEDPKTFIKSLENRKRKDAPNTSVKHQEQDYRVELPYIFVARDPSVSFAELDYAQDNAHVGELSDDNGNVTGIIDQSTVSLSFTVYFVGWQNQEVSQLATHFGMWLRQPTQAHAAGYKTALAGKPMPEPLSFEIVDRHAVTFDNASAGFNDDKVRALACILTVNADVLRIREVTETKYNLQAQRGELHE